MSQSQSPSIFPLRHPQSVLLGVAPLTGPRGQVQVQNSQAADTIPASSGGRRFLPKCVCERGKPFPQTCQDLPSPFIGQSRDTCSCSNQWLVALEPLFPNRGLGHRRTPLKKFRGAAGYFKILPPCQQSQTQTAACIQDSWRCAGMVKHPNQEAYTGARGVSL